MTAIAAAKLAHFLTISRDRDQLPRRSFGTDVTVRYFPNELPIRASADTRYALEHRLMPLDGRGSDMFDVSALDEELSKSDFDEQPSRGSPRGSSRFGVSSRE